MKECKEEMKLILSGTWTISPKWQIVIPKEVRDILWLKSWDNITFVLKDNAALVLIPSTSLDDLMHYVSQEKNIQVISKK